MLFVPERYTPLRQVIGRHLHFYLISGKDLDVKASIKKRSEDCKIVKRKGKLYVICKKNPKFKMRQG